LRERRPLLDYDPIVSVATSLMLNLLGVGEEVTPAEIVKAYQPELEAAFLPALRAAYGLIDTPTAKEECRKLVLCIAEAVEGSRHVAEKLKKDEPELKPALSTAYGSNVEECVILCGRCVYAVAAAEGDRDAAERLEEVFGVFGREGKRRVAAGGRLVSGGMAGRSWRFWRR